MARDQRTTFLGCSEVLPSNFTSLTHLFPLRVAFNNRKSHLFLTTLWSGLCALCHLILKCAYDINMIVTISISQMRKQAPKV